MNTYKLKLCPNGDWYLDNDSPMYPATFEEKINKLAGEDITGKGIEPMSGLLPGFINSFTIKKDKIDVFKKKVLSHIGYKNGSPEIGPAQIWDKDEEVEANNI